MIFVFSFVLDNKTIIELKEFCERTKINFFLKDVKISNGVDDGIMEASRVN